MDLVERYIAAVKFWLPTASKDDIAAELAEDIRCEIEEAERQKGRKLSEDEVSDLLKARGAPMVVASRYLPQRSLIGPEIMPVYLLVLKIVAAISLLPLVIFCITALFTAPETIASHLFIAPAGSLLTSFAVVTIIFAIIERKGIIPAKSQSWNPKSLPSVRPSGRIKRSESVGDITGCLVLLWLFFAGYLSRSEYWGYGGHIVLSPEWVPFWQAMLALALVETALSAINLFQPVWTAPKIFLRMMIDLGKAAAFYWLLQSHPLRSLEVPANASAIDAAKLVQYIDRLSSYAGLLMGLVAVIVVVTALWRLFRAARQHTVVKTLAGK
ncbi:MAG: hypothetical protein P4L57_04715 [Rhizomicrobium sp.]|nr:hypothetical protein [Rhizomicrobium sp.]